MLATVSVLSVMMTEATEKIGQISGQTFRRALRVYGVSRDAMINVLIFNPFWTLPEAETELGLGLLTKHQIFRIQFGSPSDCGPESVNSEKCRRAPVEMQTPFLFRPLSTRLQIRQRFLCSVDKQE
jgi:hypothetical protein